MTSVYIHTCPNGKKYVGIADNPEHRWLNGNGYRENKRFYDDICKFGWDNISHDIVKECQTREEALHFESLYIVLLDSENPEKGYNQTDIVAKMRRDAENPIKEETAKTPKVTKEQKAAEKRAGAIREVLENIIAITAAPDFSALWDLIVYIVEYEPKYKDGFRQFGDWWCIPLDSEQYNIFEKYADHKLCRHFPLLNGNVMNGAIKGGHELHLLPYKEKYYAERSCALLEAAQDLGVTETELLLDVIDRVMPRCCGL